MAEDNLKEYIRPGFPKEILSGSGYSQVIEYIGPQEDLYGAVELGKEWEPYLGVVEDIRGEPIEGTNKAVLTVVVTEKLGSEDKPADAEGEEQETIYEIDWVNVQKPLIEHPVFSTGKYILSGVDLAQIKKWRLMPDPVLKETYMFYKWDITKVSLEEIKSLSASDDDIETLSDNAQKYAAGELKGIEYFVEKAPVLRKSTIYTGGIPPEASGVGEKEPPPDFPSVPSDYEFIKEADRSINTGKQNEWRRDQEWLGVDKVWIDNKNIYW